MRSKQEPGPDDAGRADFSNLDEWLAWRSWVGDRMHALTHTGRPA
jgi:hypothetical protein